MRSFVEIDLIDAVETMGGYKWVSSACHVDLRTAYKWARREAEVPDSREPQIAEAIVGMGGADPRLLRELADVIEADEKARADGKTTPAEASFIRQQVKEAQIALEILARRREAEARKDGAR